MPPGNPRGTMTQLPAGNRRPYNRTPTASGPFPRRNVKSKRRLVGYAIPVDGVWAEAPAGESDRPARRRSMSGVGRILPSRAGSVNVRKWPNATVPSLRRRCPELADCCRSATGGDASARCRSADIMPRQAAAGAERGSRNHGVPMRNKPRSTRRRSGRTERLE